MIVKRGLTGMQSGKRSGMIKKAINHYVNVANLPRRMMNKFNFKISVQLSLLESGRRLAATW